MNRSAFLTIAAIVYVLFGLGLLVVPSEVMEVYGVDLAASGELMTRILGSALIGSALMFWLCRNASDTPAVKGIMIGHFVYNLLDIPVIVPAIMAGTMGQLGWSAVGLHVLLAIGFGVYAFSARRIAA